MLEEEEEVIILSDEESYETASPNSMASRKRLTNVFDISSSFNENHDEETSSFEVKELLSSLVDNVVATVEGVSHEYNYDVIIVGGGISGLAAARCLDNEGLRVLILEARDRAGGRIHSHTLPAMPEHGLEELDVDLGANYLIGCSSNQAEQPLFHMAKLVGMETVCCAGDIMWKYRGWECAEMSAWRDHITGEEISREDVGKMVFLLDKCMHRALLSMRKEKEKDNQNQPTFSGLMRQALSEILYLEQINGLRETMYLTQLERGIYDSLLSRYLGYVNPLSRLPLEYLEELFHDENTKIDDQLNIEYPTEEFRTAYYDHIDKKFSNLSAHKPTVAKSVNVKWEDRLVTSRFDQIIVGLKKDLNITYNCRVSLIEWPGVDRENSSNNTSVDSMTEPITIHCSVSNDSAEQINQKLTCRHCIVTVPVGVLKGLHSASKIEFSPNLPSEKVESISRLGIPHVGAPTHNKVILRYRPQDVFWEEDAPHLECPDSRFHALNLHRYGKPGVLLAHIWGHSGLYTTGKTDQEVVNVILRLLEGMYSSKNTNVKPLQTIVTRWSEDPFALGSYTCGEPGSSDQDRIIYAASLPSEENPRLLFAGEGTLSSKYAKECTHGAMQSGIERAETIMKLLRPGHRIPDWRIAKYLLGRVPSVKKHNIAFRSRSHLRRPTSDLINKKQPFDSEFVSRNRRKAKKSPQKRKTVTKSANKLGSSSVFLNNRSQTKSSADSIFSRIASINQLKKIFVRVENINDTSATPNNDIHHQQSPSSSSNLSPITSTPIILRRKQCHSWSWQHSKLSTTKPKSLSATYLKNSSLLRVKLNSFAKSKLNLLSQAKRKSLFLIRKSKSQEGLHHADNSAPHNSQEMDKEASRGILALVTPPKSESQMNNMESNLDPHLVSNRVNSVEKLKHKMSHFRDEDTKPLKKRSFRYANYEVMCNAESNNESLPPSCKLNGDSVPVKEIKEEQSNSVNSSLELSDSDKKAVEMGSEKSQDIPPELTAQPPRQKRKYVRKAPYKKRPSKTDQDGTAVPENSTSADANETTVTTPTQNLTSTDQKPAKRKYVRKKPIEKRGGYNKTKENENSGDALAVNDSVSEQNMNSGSVSVMSEPGDVATSIGENSHKTTGNNLESLNASNDTATSDLCGVTSNQTPSDSSPNKSKSSDDPDIEIVSCTLSANENSSPGKRTKRKYVRKKPYSERNSNKTSPVLSPQKTPPETTLDQNQYTSFIKPGLLRPFQSPSKPPVVSTQLFRPLLNPSANPTLQNIVPKVPILPKTTASPTVNIANHVTNSTPTRKSFTPPVFTQSSPISHPPPPPPPPPTQEIKNDDAKKLDRLLEQAELLLSLGDDVDISAIVPKIDTNSSSPIIPTPSSADERNCDPITIAPSTTLLSSDNIVNSIPHTNDSTPIDIHSANQTMYSFPSCGQQTTQNETIFHCLHNAPFPALSSIQNELILKPLQAPPLSAASQHLKSSTNDSAIMIATPSFHPPVYSMNGSDNTTLLSLQSNENSNERILHSLKAAPLPGSSERNPPNSNEEGSIKVVDSSHPVSASNNEEIVSSVRTRSSFKTDSTSLPDYSDTIRKKGKQFKTQSDDNYSDKDSSVTHSSDNNRQTFDEETTDTKNKSLRKRGHSQNSKVKKPPAKRGRPPKNEVSQQNAEDKPPSLVTDQYCLETIPLNSAKKIFDHSSGTSAMNSSDTNDLTVTENVKNLRNRCSHSRSDKIEIKRSSSVLDPVLVDHLDKIDLDIENDPFQLHLIKLAIFNSSSISSCNSSTDESNSSKQDSSPKLSGVASMQMIGKQSAYSDISENSVETSEFPPLHIAPSCETELGVQSASPSYQI